MLVTIKSSVMSIIFCAQKKLKLLLSRSRNYKAHIMTQLSLLVISANPI